MSRFSYEVREARVKKGLTLEKLARRVGTHKGYLSGIEGNKVNPPSAKVVRKMAHVLDIPEDRLLALGVVAKMPRRLPLTSLSAVVNEILMDQAKADAASKAIEESHSEQALKREPA